MTIYCDYVIVGAGSAGCVVADRLSEDGARVVLLEAGPRDAHPLIHIPAGVGHLLHDERVNWNYFSEPEPGAAHRSIHSPRGRVLGGSSSINGMVYVRGNAADFDGWARMGCRGWSYEEVLPFFRKSERYAGGDDRFRGRDGPLPVQNYRTILPLTHLFVEADRQTGFEFNEDQNGISQEGVGYAQMNLLGRRRGSTAQTFLKRARRRPNLRIETNAIATKLMMDGTRCIGAEFQQDGLRRQLRAEAEVIVCCGAFNSPHLMQASGIGPAGHLKSIGVDVVHDLPGVGCNLSDHYVVRVMDEIKGLISINQLSRGWRLIREVGRYALSGRGALSFGVTTAMVFCRSREGLAKPDLQLLFTPASYSLGRFLAFEKHPGVAVVICATQPESRGTVMATCADPLARPSIRYNYLSEAADLGVLRAGVRQARRILGAPAFAPYRVRETRPGPDVASDEEIDDFARREGLSLYHPVGTCKMGTDSMAVVDPRLRVKGLHGLRILDASVMPFLTTGNTNAPTIMIAEKGASMIREDARQAC